MFAGSGNTPGAPGTAAGHFTFRGNGIGGATFGQPQALAIAELDTVLSSPATPRPAGDAGNCTVDAYLTWPTLTAYFFHGRFAGYNSASLLAARGSGAPNVIPGAPTAAGLRIGDGVAQARRIYGSAFVVLFSQGGSWRVTTSTGMLDGYLTAGPGPPDPASPEGRGRQRRIGRLPRSLTLIDADARHAGPGPVPPPAPTPSPRPETASDEDAATSADRPFSTTRYSS